ncbi:MULTISPECIES: HalOD1 output domain-containing protein [Natrialbaceae]|uniref:HalOD1 output domain-containing protein n=1 Tax=Natrialbaceae TaxID=1644061 RepID=UPI00207C9E5D|nr:HalOD1 output domain-containing protein [Natronococcus sp. CG52]
MGDNTVYELNADESPSMAVVAAVAELTNQSTVVMEPLTETIDADALDKILESNAGNGSSVTVTFNYYGCQITITSHKILIARSE